MTRRQFLSSSLALVAFRNETLTLVGAVAGRLGRGAPDDEDFWMQIREAFVLDPNLINFNNGGVCPSPRVVQDSLRRQLEFANQAPSNYMWRVLEPEVETVRKRLARMFKVDAEEVAITRNASESLEACLFGMELKPGDEVLTTTQDYPRMITTLKQRERRDGIKLVQVNVPAAPKTQRELVDAFEKGITDKTRLMLACHVIFMTGQIYPVKDIVELGRKKGIPVIIDGAHAFAQFPFTHEDLDCDYYGASLHKWLMAPIGTGILYVRKDRIKSLWPLMAATVEQDDNIRKFEEIGTHPAANHNAIGEAITFHEMIGAERKADRLRYLRHRWADKLQNEPKVSFHTNLDPKMSCALTTVEIKGIEPGKLADWLLTNYNIFVTGIGHPDFQGIRVSPNVYTTTKEVDLLGEALLKAAREGIH